MPDEQGALEGQPQLQGQPQAAHAKATATTAKEILKEVGASSPRAIRELTATQAAGMQLAWAVGAAILVVIVFVCVDWLVMIPHARPAVNATRDVIDNYKDMRESATDDAAKLFDLIVAKALLPVFTAILGYIFGSRESSARERKEPED